MILTVVSPEPSGLASLVADLIEQNLERAPERRALLRPSVVVLDAVDAEVTIFLRIEPGEVRVATSPTRTRGSGDAERLLDLTTVPLRLGFPDVLRPEGRAVVGRCSGAASGSGSSVIRSAWRG